MQISCTVTPQSALYQVVWTSSDPEVANVSQTGLVRALKEGVAVITASIGQVYAECTVTVRDIQSEIRADVREKDGGSSEITNTDDILRRIGEAHGSGVIPHVYIYTDDTDIRSVEIPREVLRDLSKAEGILDVSTRHGYIYVEGNSALLLLLMR